MKPEHAPKQVILPWKINKNQDHFALASIAFTGSYQREVVVPIWHNNKQFSHWDATWIKTDEPIDGDDYMTVVQIQVCNVASASAISYQAVDGVVGGMPPPVKLGDQFIALPWTRTIRRNQLRGAFEKIIPLQKLEPNMGEAQAVLCVGRVLFEHPLFMFGTYDQATQSLPHTL